MNIYFPFRESALIIFSLDSIQQLAGGDKSAIFLVQPLNTMSPFDNEATAEISQDIS